MPCGKENPTNPDCFVEWLAQAIVSKKLILFLGAGISKNPPSNLPLAGEMRRYVIEKNLDIDKFTGDTLLKLLGKRVEGIIYPFEAFVEVLVNNSNFLGFLIEVFSLGSPNKTHHLIARLMREGYISEVVTTNFDEKIEQALRDLCSEENEPAPTFEVYWNEEQFSKLDLGDLKKPTIFKLHGSINDESSIRTTLESVSKRNLRESRRRILKHFFQDLDRDVVVLGYSCSDEFDLNPVIRDLSSNNHVYLIEHSPHLSLCNAEIEPLKDPFTNFKGKIIKVNASEIIEYLYKRFARKHLQEKCMHARKEAPWPSVLDNWSKSLNQGQRLWILGLMLYQIQEYSKAEVLIQQCLLVQEREKNNYGIASSQKQLGLIYETIGNLDKAKTLTKKCLEFFRTFGSKEDIASLLFQLGRINQRGNRPNVAEKFYRRSLEIYQELDNKAAIAGLCHQLSTIQEDPNKAEELCKKSLDLFDEFGNLQGLAVGTFQLGFVYIMKQDLKKAAAYTRKAMKLYRLLGSREGVTDCMFQIGTVMFLKGDLRGAEANTKKALKVFQEIGNDSKIGAANFQLQQIQGKRNV